MTERLYNIRSFIETTIDVVRSRFRTYFLIKVRLISNMDVNVGATYTVGYIC